MATDPSLPNQQKQKKSTYSATTPSVTQASKILICLGNSNRAHMSLTEICKKVGIHKSKGFTVLNSLRQYGLVEKDRETKRYSLGLGLVFLARNVLDNLDVRAAASPFLQELADGTEGTALFGLIRAEQVFIVAKHETDLHIGVNIRLGHRFHITSGAHGKAIAAFLPSPEQKRLLARNRLYFHGRQGSPDARRLAAELDECRKAGFAYDLGELQPGVAAVSAPVFGPGRRVVGCVILIGTFPHELVREYGPKARDCATKISAGLGADVEGLYNNAVKSRK